MFKLILVVLVCALSSALAADKREAPIEVTRFGNQVNADGSYAYEYDLSNGVTVQESGIGGQYANGGFRHYSPEGELVELAYTADASGFQPVGSHVPKAPPTPEYILRAIQYIQEHPTQEELIDRQRRLQYAA